jgi:histidinol-phosphate aminotransferase
MDINCNLERISFTDDRIENGIRMDRNEKVTNWNKEIFTNVFSQIKESNYTSYPSDNFDSTYKNISNYLNISLNNFCISNGADGVIREIFLMFQSKIKNVGILSNTYGMYDVYANLFNKKIINIPYLINIGEKVENICKIDKKYFNNVINDIDIFFFVNPNQVSNNDFSFNELEELCIKYPNKLFIIDEAYTGFGHYTAIHLIKKYTNIFIIRSFSKTFGLASSRIGVLIGNEKSIKPFTQICAIYSFNLYNANICNYFIENINLIEKYHEEVIEGREWFVEKLKINNYKVIDPKSLSIIVVFENEKARDDIYLSCLDKLFYLKKIKINQYESLRITCGPKELMQKLYENHFKNNEINEEYCKYLYDTRGFLVLEDAYNKDEIAHLLNEIKKINFAEHFSTDFKHDIPFRAEYFTKDNENINEILYKNKDKYFNVLKRCLITDKITLFKDKIICKNAYCKQTVPAHVDGNFITHNYRLNKITHGWYEYASEFIQFGILLTDNIKENGAIYFDKIRINTTTDELVNFHKNYIGSERKDSYIKDEVLKTHKIIENGVLMQGKLGSVFIFNPNCIHFGYENVTDNLRINLYLTFNKAIDGDNYDLAKKDKYILLQNIGIDGLNKRQIKQD